MTLPQTVGDVTPDYSRDSLITELGLKTLEAGYMLPEETSPQQVFARAANAWGSNPEHKQRLYEYSSKHWFGFASPVLANAGTNRGLPISCFLNSVEDSIEGISDHYKENGFLSTRGGGIGGYWGHVRHEGAKTSAGNETPGPIPFQHVVDSQMLAFYQGSTRRGAYAAYLPIDHPDIEEFIQSRNISGDPNRRNLNLHIAVCIPDSFMDAVRTGGTWSLRCPSTGNKVSEVSARHLWDEIMDARLERGEPYLYFTDTVNKSLPYEVDKLGYQVTHSNLCSEITLRSSPMDRTAVCCLSSVNAAKFLEWAPVADQFISDLMEMLDNVMQYFIDNAGPEFKWAVKTAEEERSVGLGLMGLHSYMQQQGVPFDSPQAIGMSNGISEIIQLYAEKASVILAKQRGVPPLLREAGVERRFTHKIAIAPTANNADIAGQVSPSIEPWAANYFQKDTKAGSFSIKNPELQKVLQELGQDAPKVWRSILQNDGSVQHLEFLSQEQKDVFKTAFEMDQFMLVKMAAERQKFICQAQSLNLFVPAQVSRSVMNKLHYQAWDQGVKTLYYLRSTALKRGEMISEQAEKVERSDYNSNDGEVCIPCQG